MPVPIRTRRRRTPRGRWLGVGALLLSLCAAPWAQAQSLQDSGLELPGVWAGQAAWGDYDGDGDADLILVGEALAADATGQRIARVLRNDGGRLVPDAAQADRLVGIYFGDAGWADYDSDGDLDLALAGWDAGGDESLRLYLNGEGAEALSRSLTVDVAQSGLLGVRYADLAWGDVDRDGDLDLLVAGMDANGASSTRLYRNGRGVFAVDEANSEALLNVHSGDLAWADYDSDGDLDLALAGENVHAEGGLRRVTEFYANDPTGSLALDPGASAGSLLNGGSLAWGDYDGDGTLDLAHSGRTESWDAVLRVYRNRPAGTLSPDPAFALNAFQRVDGALAWVDYDNDGDPDLAASGRTILSDPRAYVFENRDGSVSGVSSEASVAGLAGGAAAWGDYDGDGRVDLLLSGIDGDGQRRTVLYANSVATANRPPDPPSALNKVTVTSQRVLFSWPAGSDVESPVLSYNLRVGSDPGRGDILSSRIPERDGNAGFKTSYALARALAPDTYYWSVQAVDGALDTSAFAPEGQFFVGQFVSSDQSLRGMTNAAMAWGDADADGDVDLALMGTNRSGEPQSLVYVNREGLLRLDTGAGLTSLTEGDLAWGDYDGDGDLDLFASGRIAEGNRDDVLYRVRVAGDDSLGFDPVLRFQPALDASAVAWGDLDLDGDLDLVYGGQSGQVEDGLQLSFTRVWANDGEGSFAAGDSALVGLNNGDLDVGDVDGDGDLDLVVSGVSSVGERRTDLYRNDLDGGFVDAGAGLPGLESSDLAFGDYDRDGDLDLVAGGLTAETVPSAGLYDNDGAGGLAVRTDVALPGIQGGDLAWADYDNDQDLDLAIAGNDGRAALLQVWENTIGQAAPDSAFERASIPVLAGVDFSAVAMADPDGDGDLDLVSAGRSASFAPTTVVNDNLTAQQANPNRPPDAPSALTAVDTGADVLLAWGAAADDGAPPAGSLTYAVRVGSSSGAADVLSGTLPQGPGNAGHRLSRRLLGLDSGTYYWSVLTVDAGFAASAEAPEQSFVIDTVPPRVATVALNRTQVGLGQTLTLALELADTHAGVSSATAPTVTATIDGQSLAFRALQFTGPTWSGELTVDEQTPTGTAALSVRGAVDLKGNVLVPFDSAGAFAVDAERPAVVDRAPAAGADGVLPGPGSVRVAFSEPLDPTAITAANFSLRAGTAAVAADLEYDAAGLAVILTPTATAGLRPGTEYTVEVAAAVADLAGNPAGDAVSWSFRTRVPALADTAPTAGAAAIDDSIVARFDAAIDTAVMRQPGAVQVLREGEAVALRGTPAFDFATGILRLEPTAGLRPGSRYEVVLSGLLGGPLRAASGDGDYRWSFATAVPALTQTTPAAGSGVPVADGRIAATFGTAVDAQALAAGGAVQVLREGVAVALREPPAFDAATGVLRFEPAEGLRPGSRYEVVLSGLLGGPLRAASGDGDYRWSFATAVPALVGLTPAAGDSAVAAASGAIAAAFDADIDTAALGGDGAVQVLREGVAVALREPPAFDAASRLLRFEPAEGLRPGSRYSVVLVALLGGPLRAASGDGDYRWAFSTAVPRIASLVPTAGDDRVASGPGALVATFDAAVDTAVLGQGDAVRVLRQGVAVALREEPVYDGVTRALRFEPAGGLRPGSRYEAVLSGRLGGPLRDASGDGDFTWTFATAVPGVTALAPAALDTTVAAGPGRVVATFDGALDAEALAAGGVQLFAEGAAVAIPAPTYDAAARTLTIAPPEGLKAGTAYRVQIPAALRGPRADGDVVWTFATRIPSVAATEPADGASITAGPRTVSVRFTSAVDADLVTARSFRVTRGGQPVALDGNYGYDPGTFTATLPAIDLVSGSLYDVTVAARLGGPRSSLGDHTFAFRTDVPSVVATVPAAGAEGVPTSQATVRVSLSGRVARQDGAGFALRARSLAAVLAGGEVPFEVVPVTGFGADSSLTVVSFAPAGGLSPFTEYEVEVGREVLGPLAEAGYSWRFATAARLPEAAAGGTVTSADRALELYLPPNALAGGSGEIAITPVASGSGKAAGPQQALVAVGRAFRVDAGAATLRKPATLTLRYTAAELGRADAARLGVFALDGAGWTRVGGTADPAARAVTTTADAFGTFALFEDLAAADGSVAVRDVDCQPRAFAPAGGDLRDRTDISFDLSAAADVTVRVYNAAGRLERVVARDLHLAPGRNTLPWDGRDEDDGVVASGLYVVVVSAGGAQAEKVVAVVR